MMIGKKFLLIIFLTLVSCGYESIYAKKDDNNFYIKEIISKGDRDINRIIITQFPTNKDGIKKIPYIIKLASKRSKDIIAKDSLGNPSIYNININVKIVVKNNKTVIKKKDFNKSFSYNSMENKFDQLKYAKNVEQSLINKISEEILIFLYY